MSRMSSAMPCHTQCRLSGAIVASTLRCQSLSKWASITGRFFGDSALAARSRRSQPCVSTHIFEDNQHILKSVCSFNAGFTCTLPNVEKINMHHYVRLSPMTGFF